MKYLIKELREAAAPGIGPIHGKKYSVSQQHRRHREGGKLHEKQRNPCTKMKHGF